MSRLERGGGGLPLVRLRPCVAPHSTGAEGINEKAQEDGHAPALKKAVW